jgi:hypothetical protein
MGARSNYCPDRIILWASTFLLSTALVNKFPRCVTPCSPCVASMPVVCQVSRLVRAYSTTPALECCYLLVYMTNKSTDQFISYKMLI